MKELLTSGPFTRTVRVEPLSHEVFFLKRILDKLFHDKATGQTFLYPLRGTNFNFSDYFNASGILNRTSCVWEISVNTIMQLMKIWSVAVSGQVYISQWHFCVLSVCMCHQSSFYR